MTKYNYFTSITIIDGEYEKTSSFIIGLDSPSLDEAENFAMSCEAHNSIEIDEDGNHWDGHMILEVSTLTKLTKKELEVMRKHLNYLTP